MGSRTKIVLLCMLVVLIGLLSVPRPAERANSGRTLTMVGDILIFNGAVTGYSLFSSGYSSGVGLELSRNGDAGRGIKEFLRFWDYEFSIPESKRSFKQKNLLVAHPLIGYQFSNYLLARGYSKKRALLTTAIGAYLLEKGIQGSFETPTAYDLLSYFTGSVISVMANDHIHSLYHRHFLLKPLAIGLNPFVLFHRPGR